MDKSIIHGYMYKHTVKKHKNITFLNRSNRIRKELGLISECYFIHFNIFLPFSPFSATYILLVPSLHLIIPKQSRHPAILTMPLLVTRHFFHNTTHTSNKHWDEILENNYFQSSHFTLTRVSWCEMTLLQCSYACTYSALTGTFLKKQLLSTD